MGWWAIPLGIVNYVPVFTLTPRFILNVRALYERDVQRHYELSNMGSEFGWTSVSRRGVRKPSSSIVFAGLSEVEGSEQYESISMGGKGA